MPKHSNLQGFKNKVYLHNLKFQCQVPTTILIIQNATKDGQVHQELTIEKIGHTIDRVKGNQKSSKQSKYEERRRDYFGLVGRERPRSDCSREAGARGEPRPAGELVRDENCKG